MSTQNIPELRELIEKFLKVNPEPADAQFHAFAESLGVDKETLESIAYEMLGSEIEHEADEGDVEQEQNLITHEARVTARLRSKISAASTHFEVGEGGEYGENRPGDEADDECMAFDLAVDAPKTKAQARLQASSSNSWMSDAEGHDEAPHDKHHDEAYNTVADAGAPGDHGLSEQQEVLQGDQDPTTQDTNNVALNDGAPIGETTDNQTQDSLLVDGPLAEAALHDSADQAFLLNDGRPELELRVARRLKASTVAA